MTIEKITYDIVRDNILKMSIIYDIKSTVEILPP